MSRETTNTSTSRKKKTYDNPFIVMINEKKRIIKAIRAGKDLSTLKGINIVSPI
jgi:hypothetical protein